MRKFDKSYKNVFDNYVYYVIVDCLQLLEGWRVERQGLLIIYFVFTLELNLFQIVLFDYNDTHSMGTSAPLATEVPVAQQINRK
jgi:hypothetical protein